MTKDIDNISLVSPRGYNARKKTRSFDDENFKVIPDDIGQEGYRIVFEAEKDFRSSEARRLGLLSIDFFRFDALILPLETYDKFSLNVHFCADVVQSCIITLEPVRSRIDETFKLCYSRLLNSKNRNEHGWFDPMEKESFEMFKSGKIDVGDVVMEHLVLALDPYPRKKDVEFEFNTKNRIEKNNPFSVLSDKKLNRN